MDVTVSRGGWWGGLVELVEGRWTETTGSGGHVPIVIDVDSHWEASVGGPGRFPVPGYEDRLPGDLGSVAHALAGELLHALPPELRPSDEQLLAHLVDAADDGVARIHPAHESVASERVAWMDRVGIDHELVNPGNSWQQLALLGDARAEASGRHNDYLAEQLWSHRDRLHGVATIDFSDLEAAVAEMTRARGLGFRGFFFYSEFGHPPNGVSPGHPAWDRVWSAATDLGMVAVLHVGNTTGDFGGWANVGWDQPDGCGVGALLRLANSQRMPVAQSILNGLVFGGTFARHPTLTVILEEMWSGWLPWYVRRTDATTRVNPVLGDWPYELTGGEMLRRNVRLTPLPGFGDGDGLDVLAELPEMVVFSSDYPHLEGNADPIQLYRPGLDDLDPDVRNAFLGANVEECFARMGDPLGA